MRFPGIIILAAGGSRRMGQPKQLLPWLGTTLIRHAARTALESRCRPVVVVLGAEVDQCRRELEGLTVTTVDNTDWPSGMGSSVAAGIGELERISPEISGALLLLVDQPGVTISLLASLLENWSRGQSISATRYPEGGGVPAIFDRRFFHELRALSGDRGAREIICRNVDEGGLVEARSPLTDLDTPEAFQKLIAGT